MEDRIKLNEEKTASNIRLAEEISDAKIKHGKDDAEADRAKLVVLEQAEARRSRKRDRKARRRVIETVPEKRAKKDTEPKQTVNNRPSQEETRRDNRETRKVPFVSCNNLTMKVAILQDWGLPLQFSQALHVLQVTVQREHEQLKQHLQE